MTTDPRAIRRRFLLLTALRWLPVGLMAPVFVLVMQQRGLSLSSIGLAVAAQGAAVFVLELPTGGLADSLGRRPVLVASAILHLGAMLLFLFAQDVVGFVLAAALTGVFRALDSGPLQSWYVDATLAEDPEADVGVGLAAEGTVVGLALAGGSLLAGFGGQLVPGVPESGAVVSRVSLPILAALPFIALDVVALLGLVHEAPRHGRSRVRRAVADVPAVIGATLRLARRRRTVAALLGAELLWAMGMTGVEVLWQPRFASLLEAPAESLAIFGLASAAGWGAVAGGSAVAPVVGRRFGDGVGTALLRTVHALLLVGLALAGGLLLAFAAYVAVFAAHGAANPLHSKQLHGTVEQAQPPPSASPPWPTPRGSRWRGGSGRSSCCCRPPSTSCGRRSAAHLLGLQPVAETLQVTLELSPEEGHEHGSEKAHPALRLDFPLDVHDRRGAGLLEGHGDPAVDEVRARPLAVEVGPLEEGSTSVHAAPRPGSSGAPRTSSRLFCHSGRFRGWTR